MKNMCIIQTDISGNVVGESPDCVLLSGTVVGENPDHVCWDGFLTPSAYLCSTSVNVIVMMYVQHGIHFSFHSPYISV